MSQHTQSPWNYDGHGINHQGERIFKTCLNYEIDSSDRQRAQADSKLVAAAPELLEACRAALGHAQLLGSGQHSPYSNAEMCDILGAAIRKAGG